MKLVLRVQKLSDYVEGTKNHPADAEESIRSAWEDGDLRAQLTLMTTISLDLEPIVHDLCTAHEIWEKHKSEAAKFLKTDSRRQTAMEEEPDVTDAAEDAPSSQASKHAKLQKVWTRAMQFRNALHFHSFHCIPEFCHSCASRIRRHLI